ncbi:LLM class F420-dependent oxidoreductase [Mycolicibacterium sp.]|uniref:LLM class F420-dependent oxidoreductase n=1 Tax=Mycolicibacterium sp. TaxID=2320850 RepID=UPI003D0AE11B
MSSSIVLFPDPHATNAVDDYVAQARRAHELGVRQVWFSQQFTHDAITLAGLIGAAVPGLGVGTSAVPFNPRHPLTLASQAQTAQGAAHGAFSLGLGLGANQIEHTTFGIAPVNTIARLREYLTILQAVFHTGDVDFHGEHYTAAPTFPTTLPGGAPVPVYVAAMGPKALRVTGELADGTLPYLAGPRTIGEFIVPTITKAAAEAGRPDPRIVAFVPVQLVDDAENVDTARAAAAEQLAFYTAIPSYRNVLDREGVDNPADLAAVGDAETVRRTVARYRDAGATDVVFSPLDRQRPDERLWELAGSR